MKDAIMISALFVCIVIFPIPIFQFELMKPIIYKITIMNRIVWKHELFSSGISTEPRQAIGTELAKHIFSGAYSKLTNFISKFTSSVIFTVCFVTIFSSNIVIAI